MKFLFGATLFVVLVTFGLAAAVDQNKDLAGTKRIIGGVEISQYTQPWMAAIFQKNGSKEELLCSGVLVDKQWIVSSAMCIFDSTQDFKVILGDHNILRTETGEQPFNVVKFAYHPNFTTTVKYNLDVALLKLDRKATLNNRVKVLSLPPAYTPDVPVGTMCNLTGWGSTLLKSPNKMHRSPVLRKITIPIVNHTECRRVNRARLSLDVDTTSLCAGFQHARSNFSGGMGDAGSPLICKEKGKDVFRGIGSWGGFKDTYSVSTKVTEVVDWIKAKITSGLPQNPLSSCHDNHYFCQEWLKRGDCKGYMKKLVVEYCPASCNKFDIVACANKGTKRMIDPASSL